MSPEKDKGRGGATSGVTLSHVSSPTSMNQSTLDYQSLECVVCMYVCMVIGSQFVHF